QEHPDLAVGEATPTARDEGEETAAEATGADHKALLTRNAPATAAAPASGTPEGQRPQGAELDKSAAAPPPPPPPSAGEKWRASHGAKALESLGAGRGKYGTTEAEAGKQRALEAIDPSAVVTTGPGLPRWRWNQVTLRWDGPVTRTQRLRLFLLPPAAT